METCHLHPIEWNLMGTNLKKIGKKGKENMVYEKLGNQKKQWVLA